MNGVIEEWIAKAEGDFQTAGRELKVKEHQNFDAVCFHAQQCVEKLMKALLIDRGVTPPKTHDLVHLHHLLLSAVDKWAWSVPELQFLTRAAVDFRYPGESADLEQAKEAFGICERLRKHLLTLL